MSQRPSVWRTLHAEKPPGKFATHATSSDHLACLVLEVARNVDAEIPCAAEVQYERNLPWRRHRDRPRVLAMQHAQRYLPRLPPYVGVVARERSDSDSPHVR